MKYRILAAALAAFFMSAAHADAPVPVGKVLIEGRTSTTTTGPGYASLGAGQRIIAHSSSGTYSATVTVYGTNVYCGNVCSASSLGATSVGTITSDGGSVDNSTYLYYFALITSYTSGTLSVEMAPQPTSSGTVTATGAMTITSTLGADTAITTTNLQSLASSATAGWSSGVLDNSSTLYSDILVNVTLDPANTAPASTKSFFLYAFGGTNSSNLATTGAATGGTPGTEGALTFPDVTTTPNNGVLVCAITYQNADVVQKKTCSLQAAFGGTVPPFVALGIVNASGAALAGSGNVVTIRGVSK